MPIKTNLPSLKPRRQTFRKEITLPSRGFTNPTAWPDGKLIVYPWDATVDDYLLDNARKSSRNDIFYGLLGKVCDLNGGKVDEFIATEVIAVLLVARALSVTGTGQVQYRSACPACRAESTENIHIPEELAVVGEKKSDYPGYDDIVLPDCKDVVRVRPLTIGDERIIIDRSQEIRSKVSDRKLRALMAVVTVNESRPDSLEEMVQYYDALSPSDVRFLEEEENRLSPQLDTVIPHQCDACGHKYKQALNFDVEFFR